MDKEQFLEVFYKTVKADFEKKFMKTIDIKIDCISLSDICKINKDYIQNSQIYCFRYINDRRMYCLKPDVQEKYDKELLMYSIIMFEELVKMCGKNIKLDEMDNYEF